MNNYRSNLVVILASILCAGMVISYLISNYMGYKFAKSLEQTLREALHWGTWVDGSAAYGGSKEQLQAAYSRLQSSAALMGEAPRNNKKLVIAVIRYDWPEKAGKARPAFTPLTLDVKGLDKAGVVLIYDGPTALRVINARYGQRAKLALEGQAPVLPAGEIPEGFISAMRIEGYGLGKARNPRDLDGSPREFCHAMLFWARTYYIHPRDIVIRTARIPVSGGVLTISDSDLSVRPGENGEHYSLFSLCEDYGMARNSGFE